MVRRAQVSLEFLMIVGLAMVLMISSSYLVYDFTQSETDQGAMQQVASIGYRLIDQAANMYVYGSGSFITLQASLPQAIQDIYIAENSTVVFELATGQGIAPVYVFSDIAINGTESMGGQEVRIVNSSRSINPGTAQFRVTSKGDWVEITIKQ